MTDSHSFYRAIPPPPPLRPFIRSLWIYDGYHPEHLVDRVLPTATLEIVIPLLPSSLFDGRKIRLRDGHH
ncbi:DUF6597 domain-containing transcriptional factor [Sorangium sp. So ce134]